MKRIILALVLLPSLLYFAPTGAQAQRKLLILGSSTSRCAFGITWPDSCYVNRVQRYYADRGFPITIDNRAQAGEDVYRGMPADYIPPPGRRTPYADTNITAGLQANPDVVLINYPSNGYDSFSVAEVMACFRIIRNAAVAAGKPCYITTTQPRQAELFSTSRVRKVMAEIKDSVLAQFGPFAVNFWDGIVNPVDTTILPQYNADNTHFTNAGNAILAQRVIEKNIFNVVLPVRIVNFTGNSLPDGVQLKWTVADEKSMKSYQLQKSTDGRVFRTIFNVAADNNDKQHDYIFTDRANLGRSAFYRLAITGSDNFINTSAVVEVRGKNAPDKIYVAGSATLVAEINFSKLQSVTIGIYNAGGQLLSSSNHNVIAGNNRLNISIGQLQKGLYYLKVIGAGVDNRARSFTK
jgi:hypothetical protein